MQSLLIRDTTAAQRLEIVRRRVSDRRTAERYRPYIDGWREFDQIDGKLNDILDDRYVGQIETIFSQICRMVSNRVKI